MKTFSKAASLIVGVSLIGFVLMSQRAYQQSWSDSAVAPTVTAADTSSVAATFTGGAETIVMK